MTITEPRSIMMLKVLINKFNPKAGNAFLKFLPPEEIKAVESQENIDSADILPLMKQPQTIIEKMHYSWIKPLLNKFPKEMHPLILGALNSDQAKGLKKIASVVPANLTTMVKDFIIDLLFSEIDSNHLPLEYLPETELSPLAQWDKKELLELIDFLGLHDLALDIRSIVNKKHLENFYSCLSQKQLYYLRICLSQKERLTIPKLGINPAVKDCNKLKTVLHQRGLMRLGKALCGEHPDHLWYIIHTLDTGRGKILQHYYQKEPIPKVTFILSTQVINVMNFLKKNKT